MTSDHDRLFLLRAVSLSGVEVSIERKFFAVVAEWIVNFRAERGGVTVDDLLDELERLAVNDDPFYIGIRDARSL